MRKLRRQFRKKKDRLKTWKRTSAESDRKEYKLAKSTAKKVVVRVKAEAINGLYDNMETVEGQKDVYIIAAARDIAGKDIGQINLNHQKCNRRGANERRIHQRAMGPVFQLAHE